MGNKDDNAAFVWKEKRATPVIKVKCNQKNSLGNQKNNPHVVFAITCIFILGNQNKNLGNKTHLGNQKNNLGNKKYNQGNQKYNLGNKKYNLYRQSKIVSRQ